MLYKGFIAKEMYYAVPELLELLSATLLRLSHRKVVLCKVYYPQADVV